jgi:hypothetical protein
VEKLQIGLIFWALCICAALSAALLILSSSLAQALLSATLLCLLGFCLTTLYMMRKRNKGG